MNCLLCGHNLDEFAAWEPGEVNLGDITVCVYCGCLLEIVRTGFVFGTQEQLSNMTNIKEVEQLINKPIVVV